MLQEVSPYLNPVVAVYAMTLLVLYRISLAGTHLIKTLYILTLILLNISWLINGGSTGSIAYFYLTSVILPIVLFTGKTRSAMLLLMILNYSTLIFVEMRFPYLIVPFATSNDRYFDLLTGFAVSVLIILIIFRVVVSGYDRKLLQHEKSEEELEHYRLNLEKLVQEQAREINQSEQRYRSFIENASDIIFTLSSEGIVLYVSPNATDALGYELDEVVGKSFAPFVHHDDVAHCFSLLKLVLETNVKQNDIEFRILHKHGTWIWYSANGSVLHDTANNQVSFLGIGRDISYRKMTEETLRKSEEKFRLLYESAGDSISVIDYQGRVLTVNPYGHKLLGYTYEEMTNLSLAEIDSPENFSQVPGRLEKLFKNGKNTFDTEHICKDGSTIAVSVDSQLIEWDGQPAILNVCRDISERKKIETALQKSEERFRSIMALSPDIISIIGIDGSLIYNSPATLSIHGYSNEELLGQNTFELIHPDDQQHVAKAFDEIVKTPTQIQTVQYRYKNNDGSYVWMECTASNQIDNPLINGLVTISRCIESRKQQELEKIEFERQLLQAQKLESLGVMAGGIAHDFNNLLQSILGNIELVGMRLDSDSKSKEYINHTKIAGKKAAHLAELMLTYAGNNFIEKKTLNLNELVIENSEILQSAATAAVEIFMNLAEELPAIVADEAQMQQLVMNLITNAAEAITEPKGFVKITTGVMECDQAFLATSLIKEKLKPGCYVFIEVSDNGCGMDNETINRLFDPFFTTKFTGRGLGMSAVMGIMKSHDGGLFVQSEIGKGTNFRAIFPATEIIASTTVPDSASLEQPVSKGEPLKGLALIVDDDKSVLRNCATMVRLIGLEVITAHDGSAAISRFQQQADEIDVVIMDLTMPNMDGITAMQEIYKIRPDAKILLASGFKKEELDKREASKPPAGFIRKPYSMSELKREIRQVMQII